MLVSQRSAYQLQQKLNHINSRQEQEIDSLYPYGNTMSTLKPMIFIIERYNKVRQRAIWWAQYKNDVIAGCIVAAVIGLSVYFVVG